MPTSWCHGYTSETVISLAQKRWLHFWNHPQVNRAQKRRSWTVRLGRVSGWLRRWRRSRGCSCGMPVWRVRVRLWGLRATLLWWGIGGRSVRSPLGTWRVLLVVWRERFRAQISGSIWVLQLLVDATFLFSLSLADTFLSLIAMLVQVGKNSAYILNLRFCSAETF